MITEIDFLFERLNSDLESVQLTALEDAKKIKTLSVFFQPIESKELWYNCAKVITQRGNDELQTRYLFKMFSWLQDINWPGADIIYDRLLEFNSNELIEPFLFSFKQAQGNNDQMWILCLQDFAREKDDLKQLLEQRGKNDLFND